MSSGWLEATAIWPGHADGASLGLGLGLPCYFVIVYLPAIQYATLLARYVSDSERRGSGVKCSLYIIDEPGGD